MPVLAPQAPIPFSLDELRRLLRDFLNNQLPAVLSTSTNPLEWPFCSSLQCSYCRDAIATHEKTTAVLTFLSAARREELKASPQCRKGGKCELSGGRHIPLCQMTLGVASSVGQPLPLASFLPASAFGQLLPAFATWRQAKQRRQVSSQRSPHSLGAR